MIGDLIMSARLDAGLTQAELAARAGTSQATLCAYEREGKDPSVETAARILAAAGWRLSAKPGSGSVWTPRRTELARRGRILAEVVDLAARLPGSQRGHLAYPPLTTVVRGGEGNESR